MRGRCCFTIGGGCAAWASRRMRFSAAVGMRWWYAASASRSAGSRWCTRRPVSAEIGSDRRVDEERRACPRPGGAISARRSVSSEVPLVEHDHDRGAGGVDALGEPLVLVGHAFGRVDDEAARRRRGRSLRARARGCSTRSARRSRLLRRSPAVSTNRSGPSSVSTTVSIASRVVPGMSCTTERSSPTSRLNSVDLPTFGRPTIATEKMPSRRSGSASRSLSGRSAARRRPRRAARRLPGRASPRRGTGRRGRAA